MLQAAQTLDPEKKLDAMSIEDLTKRTYAFTEQKLTKLYDHEDQTPHRCSGACLSGCTAATTSMVILDHIGTPPEINGIVSATLCCLGFNCFIRHFDADTSQEDLELVETRVAMRIKEKHE